MKKILILSALVASIASVKAADEPFFQASLTPDIAIHSKDTKISGICLSVWGENPGRFCLGFCQWQHRQERRFDLVVLFNYNEDYTGVAWAMVNYSKGKFQGLAKRLFQLFGRHLRRPQSGCVNCAQEFHGLQWGFVNYAKELHGLQIGFANIAMNNPWFRSSRTSWPRDSRL